MFVRCVNDWSMNDNELTKRWVETVDNWWKAKLSKIQYVILIISYIFIDHHDFDLALKSPGITVKDAQNCLTPKICQRPLNLLEAWLGLRATAKTLEIVRGLSVKRERCKYLANKFSNVLDRNLSSAIKHSLYISKLPIYQTELNDAA